MAPALITLVNAIIYIGLFLVVCGILFWLHEKAKFAEPWNSWIRWGLAVILILIVLLWLAGSIPTPPLIPPGKG